MGGVWRAERLCQGDDVNLLKLAMNFSINKEKGEVMCENSEVTSVEKDTTSTAGDVVMQR